MKSKYSVCWILIWMMIPARNALGQSQNVRATIEPTQAQIGEYITLTVQAASTAGEEVGFPVLGDTLSGMEVLNRSEIEEVESEEGIHKVQSFTLIAFDSGEYRIPALPLVKGGDTLFTNPLSVMLSTVAVDTSQEIKAIKDPLAVKYTLEELLPLLLVILFILLVIGFVVYWFFLRKPEKKEEVAKPKIIIPPHEIAMRKLAKLEEEKLWQQGEVKAYYSELTDIVREYLEKRYSILALESTTDEIMRDLREKLSERLLREKLRGLLQNADLAKFAKFIPDAADNVEAMDIARDFIKSTKAVPSSNPQRKEALSQAKPSSVES